MKILGALLELLAKQHCQSSPFTSKLFKSVAAMGANYSFYVKSIAICAPKNFVYIISVLASVYSRPLFSKPISRKIFFRFCLENWKHQSLLLKFPDLYRRRRLEISHRSEIWKEELLRRSQSNPANFEFDSLFQYV